MVVLTIVQGSPNKTQHNYHKLTIYLKGGYKMRRIAFLALSLTLAISASAMAGKITSTMIQHFNQVYQAYPGSSDPCKVIDPCDTFLTTGATERCFLGYNGLGCDVISSVPGILCIRPGSTPTQPWANYILAAQAGVAYTIKNTTLVKQTPSYVQCSDIFPAHRVTQQGTPNIRLWWPLMYEVPSTTFTLTILYGTPTLYDDDGPAGPNPPAYVHVEQWVWHVDATLASMSRLLELFHELPFGLDEVPLISDEPLYCALQEKIASANAAYIGGDTATAAAFLTDFELEVMDACIGVSPSNPNPTGPGTGIANTLENPACCKLLVDVEYILQNTGIGMPGK